MKNITLIELILSLCLGALLGFCFGAVYVEKSIQNEAVERNCAHWAAGPDGSAKFTWGKKE